MRIFKKPNIEFSKEKELSSGSKLIGSVKDFVDAQKFNREALVKQLPFLLFLAVLAIVYIANQYHAERLVNDVNSLKETRNEKRAEYISSASDLMKITQQSEVIRLINEQNLELKPLTSPPKKIRVKP
jgi:hypothetical protein